MKLTCALIGACMLHLVSSEVQRFQSSLATTGRRHACGGELLTFTCEVVGSRLDWRVDSIHRARYFDTNRVDEVRTVNGPSIMFRTILTGNDEVTESDTAESSRRLSSTLIAELSQPSANPHSISCSSDSQSRLLQFQVAERPSQPANVTVSIIHPVSSPTDPYSLTVQWDAPANIDNFDLEHYTIQAPSSEVGKEYQLNVTGSELEYPFGMIMNTSLPRELSNLTVSAVSRCSQKGPKASAALPAPNVNPIVQNTNAHMDNSQITTTRTLPVTISGTNGGENLQASRAVASIATVALLTTAMMFSSDYY